MVGNCLRLRGHAQETVILIELSLSFTIHYFKLHKLKFCYFYLTSKLSLTYINDHICSVLQWFCSVVILKHMEIAVSAVVYAHTFLSAGNGA